MRKDHPMTALPADGPSLPDLMPRRHGADRAKARRVAASLRFFLPGQGPHDPAPLTWRALQHNLLEGDPPADRLVAWMKAEGMARGQALFEEVLRLGLEAVPQAPEPLRAFFQQVQTWPDWVDPTRLDAGARACHRSGLTGMQVLRDAALMAGYQAGAINQTLVRTGSLARGAQRRVAETTHWWLDCTALRGLSPRGAGFAATLRVRLMHAIVRARLKHDPQWDADSLGLPVNQTDMQATYLGFSVIFLLGQRVMGIPLQRQEAEDAMHLWKAIGWLMGVKEELLADSEAQGRLMLWHNLLSQAPADATSVALGQALHAEPLSRHYGHRRAWMNRLHGRFEQAKHLSICQWFMSRESLRDLGLPTFRLPWFPLLTVPGRWLSHALIGWHPAGRRWLSRRGRQAQQNYLRVLFGQERPALGAH